MKNKKSRKREIIRRKEFLIILLGFFLITNFLLILNVSLSYSQKLKSNKEIVNLVSQTIVEDYENSLEEINTISKKVFLEEPFFDAYDSYQQNKENEEMTTYLNDQFEEYRSELIRGVGFIPGKDEMNIEENLYLGNYSDLFYLDSPHFNKMIKEIDTKLELEKYQTGKMFCFYDDETTSNQAIVFIRKIKDLRASNFGEEIGISYVVINKQTLLNLFNVGKVIEGYYPLVVSEDSFTIGSNEIDINNINNSRYYTYYSGFSSEEYTFYGTYDKQLLIKEMSREFISEAMVYLSIMIVFTLLYYKIHTDNQKSFNYLVHSFENSKTHYNLDLIPLTKSDNDVNKVIRVYNEMVTSYVNEKNNRELLEIEKNKFEIQSLYSQINKHFIINVLSIVHSFIVLNEMDNATACLEDLSDYLRYNLSFNLTKATLKDEVNSINSYVNLQRYRYPNVKISFDIEENLQEITLPKMILQPLVENAYVHGLKTKEGNLKLVIKKKDNKLIIKVMNTSSMISKEDLETINKKITDPQSSEMVSGNHGIALNNIKKRLEIAFPSSSRLYIDNDGKNTISIIEINLKEDEKC